MLVLLTDCHVLMHLALGDAAVSHRDLVSIIPYSSVAADAEDDDHITAHHDPRRPRPVAIANKQTSSPDRQEAIRMLVGYLENLVPDMKEELLPVDDNRSSPGRDVTWRT